jgi:N-acetylmuramoyl-L-alanine amidase
MLCHSRKNGYIIPFALFVAAVCLLLRLGPVSGHAVSESCMDGVRTVVIDAGHGGPDGGATGRSGTLEKDINLKIALLLRDFCDYFGIKNKMIRDADISLHSAGADTIREKKTEDMKNRLKITQKQQNPVYVGIHQNYYGGFISRGAQTFYSDKNPKNKPLAELILDNIKKFIDPENNRKAGKISKDNYILDNLSCPAVIIECGFLSNPEEEMLLCSPAYQREMAYAIAAGVFTAVTQEIGQ